MQGRYKTAHERLKRHRRKHMGKGLYQCRNCGNAFMEKGHLATHLHSPTCEHTHQCSHCSKVFMQQDNLPTYLYEHIGKRPHRVPPVQRAPPVQPLREGLHSGQPGYPPAHPHRRAPLPVQPLWQGLHGEGPPARSHGESCFQCSHCGTAFMKKGHPPAHPHGKAPPPAQPLQQALR
ncbi:uncharacterized protein LOC144179109 isoform X1 [Haemaphysalis longicornis]